MDSSGQAGIDLHIHSTASDGTLAPSEIVSAAEALGLAAIAITDHDTIAGAREALAYGIPDTLQFVTGVEISAKPLFKESADSSYHILGYCIDLDDPALNRLLKKLQGARSGRNPKIIKKLKALGFDLDPKEVQALSGDGQVGRPHIAQAMLNKGYVASIDQAFDDYLIKGKPAYVDKFRIDCAGAIQTILGAGGIPVLAHPGLLQLNRAEDLEPLVASLKAMGLMGLEVFYPQHTPRQIDRLTAMADAMGLLITGGTDFHGELNPSISMGSGKGSLFVPFQYYESLRLMHLATKRKHDMEKTLGYCFQNPDLLLEALSHSSFVNELSNLIRRDNERFEFLGDAVLNLVVGDLLMQHDPNLREGDLTRTRSAMVNEQQLANLARSMGLGEQLFLGKGESATGGKDKSSILADALEALTAAIYLDGGFSAAAQFVKSHFSPMIEPLLNSINAQDYKSELQEFVQSRHLPGPVYTLYDASGPDHDKTFRFRLEVCKVQTRGVGKSKKAAEQDAARIALQILRRDFSESKP